MRLDSGRSISLGSRLGGGGEADVFEVIQEPDLVAKVYAKGKADAARAAKVAAMAAKRPEDPTEPLGHCSLAWPVESLHHDDGTFAGFVMPRISSGSHPILRLYNPRDRRTALPGFTWRYLLRTASNLASAVDALHHAGYVVGDLNESNLLVEPTALVTIVDCDSMQVPDGMGGFFLCPVGKPEFTPPELQGADFAISSRTPESDAFSLAVLIFLVLMEGQHPFSGVWMGQGNPPAISEAIGNGDFAFGGLGNMAPARHALPFTVLPQELRSLFLRTFGEGLAAPDRRATPGDWHAALERAESSLSTCPLNGQHVFSSHLGSCPWCDRVKRGANDPFPSPSRPQVPLPTSHAPAQPQRNPFATRPATVGPAGHNPGAATSPAPQGPPQARHQAPGTARVSSRRKFIALGGGGVALAAFGGFALTRLASGDDAPPTEPGSSATTSAVDNTPTRSPGSPTATPTPRPTVTPVPTLPPEQRNEALSIQYGQPFSGESGLGGLRVRLLNVDSGVDNAQVEVFAQRLDAQGAIVLGDRAASRYTDNTGSASFSLAPGEYALVSGLRGYPWGSLREENGEPGVLVQAGRTTVVTVQRGRLVVSVLSPDGVRENRQVEVFFERPNANGLAVSNGSVRTLYTDNTGSVQIDVTPGSYIVHSPAAGYNWGDWSEDYGQTGVIVKAAEITSLAVEFARVNAVVRRSDGSLRSNVSFELFTIKRDANGQSVADFQAGQDYTDNTGTASMYVIPGTYLVEIAGDPYGTIDVPLAQAYTFEYVR